MKKELPELLIELNNLKRKGATRNDIAYFIADNKDYFHEISDAYISDNFSSRKFDIEFIACAIIFGRKNPDWAKNVGLRI